MRFNLFTKTVTSKYIYTELELIAEFGGYVGLFLGYSVIGFADGFAALFVKLRKYLDI